MECRTRRRIHAAPSNVNHDRRERIMNLIRRGSSPLAAYRPGTVEDQFGRMVESMFQDFLAPLQGRRGQEDGLGLPRLDVSETDAAFEIQAELPGVRKEDIKVSVEGSRVTIEGECQQGNEQRQGEQVVYSERSTRRYQRSFTLPSEVDDTGAEARLENGILMLTLPKKQGNAARRLTIQ
jgi:HSP20 family protein